MSNGDFKVGGANIKVPEFIGDPNFPPLTGVTSDLSTAGVAGVHRSRGPGVHGESDAGGPGVSGFSKAGDGVVGRSQAGDKSGVFGGNSKGNGVSGFGLSTGVYGENKTGRDVEGAAVWGNSTGGGTGVAGTSDTPSGVGVYGRGAALAARFDGDVEVTGDIRLVNADCAEDFDISAGERVEPGTVMVIDETGCLQQGQQAYDKRVAGVISGAGGYKPGILLDRQQSQDNRLPIALLGKVYCKVDAQYSPIQVGDLLTTAPTPGHAMKAVDPERSFGAVVGKALQPLLEGKGLIPILIALQ